MTTPPENLGPLPTRFNLAEYLLDARVAEGRGDAVAVITINRSWRYREVLERSHRAAGALVQAGVKPGDRVLLALPDSIAFIDALLGAMRMGAVATMANPELPAADLLRLIMLTGARAIVTTPAVMSKLDPRLLAEQAAVFTTSTRDEKSTPTGPQNPQDNPQDDPQDWEDALSRAPANFATPATGPDDVAMWLFTSGSTGAPRAAIHRHRDFAAHIQCYARGVLDLRASDVTLSVPRLHFPYATGMNLMFPFAVGASIVLFPERPTPENIFEYIQRFTPTIFTTVPTMTAKMLALPQPPRPARLSSLRLSVSAGEALPAELFQRWHDTYGVEMLDGIGSAEMFHIYISNRPGDARPDCHGQLVAGYQARIVREDGSDADVGELGTLWIRGPSAAIGYHGDEEANRAVFQTDTRNDSPGWVVSGDVFRRDGDGYFHYEGRSDDLMKVAGLYVSPLEVEAVLRRHPSVEDCAVAGARDADGLIKPRAYVVLREGSHTGPDLHGSLPAFARQHLAPYKVPREFVVVPELPRNDRGKVLRRVLRERDQTTSG